MVGQRPRHRHPKGSVYSELCRAELLVVLLGGLSPLQPPMDLVGLGCRHSRIRYSNPGRRTIGIGSGDAGATAPTTIFASSRDERGLRGIGAVMISTGSP